MNFFRKRRAELEAAAGETVSQHDLAIKLGVTGSAIGAWEREIVAPSLRLAPKLAVVYQVPVETIEAAIVELTRKIAANQKSAAKRMAGAH